MFVYEQQIYKKKRASKLEALFFYMELLVFFRQLAAQCQVSDRSGEEQRTKCTDYYTENHCKCEAADAFTTEDEDAEEHDER